MHWKCEEVGEKGRNTNNAFVYIWLATQFYICWFVFTWLGRFFLAFVLFGIFIVNLELHAIRPAARTDIKTQQEIRKLQKEWSKINNEAEHSIFINPWNHETVLKLKKYDFLRWKQRQIEDQIRILREESYVKNGFESWQNRLLFSLPKCMLNTNLKRKDRLLKWKVAQRAKDKKEQEHEKLH